MSEPARLDVENVGHVYGSGPGRIEALRDVTFSVSSGEIACVVGTSGCGKSTLLRIVAGLASPTTGSVAVGDRRVQGVADDVGLVFQNYDDTLLKWRSVHENVRIGAELGRDGHDPDEVARRYLDLVGLEAFGDSRPDELSGGMKQRVQVARMLAYDPDVLLCDEPFGALDAQTKRLLQEEFLEILRTNPKTTLFVTHDIGEAIFLGDVIYVFTEKNPGRIGERREIDFDRPRFPRSEFERRHSGAVVEEKSRVYEVMEL